LMFLPEPIFTADCAISLMDNSGCCLEYYLSGKE
jgi:hypothetical protein